MREILFRGKRKDNGEWVCGSLWLDDCQIKECESLSISWWSDEGTVWNREEVIPETVGQYTGLTDKNGTKIFEGDIVKYDFLRNFNDLDLETAEEKENCVGVVKFENGKFYPLPNIDYCEDCWYGVAYDNFEVIGNIHDNPELLGNE